jgi:hypothetical protein
LLIKLFKLALLLLTTGIATFYIIHKSQPNQEIAKVRNLSTDGESIAFRKKLKNGTLTLSAKSAKLNEKDGSILLKNVRSVFYSKQKDISVSCSYCTFRVKERKAYLTRDVCLKSSETVCYTKSAVVNLVDNSISSNSTIRGLRNGVKFLASGFHLNESGKITLKRAKIVKK